MECFEVTLKSNYCEEWKWEALMQYMLEGEGGGGGGGTFNTDWTLPLNEQIVCPVALMSVPQLEKKDN